MTPADFLRLVVPEGRGLLCIGVKLPTGGFSHKFLPSADEAARIAQAIDAKGKDVYFALGSFADAASRKQSNVTALKALWLDVDCGEGKPYLTQRDGLAALGEFLRKTGLPRPTIVNSGRGLHVYWPLTAPIEPREWKAAAIRLKALAEVECFEADPVRTADCASVLRPIGTRNHKTNPPLNVALVYKSRLFTFDELCEKLNVNVDPLPAYLRNISAEEINRVLGWQSVQVPRSGRVVVQKCAQLRALVDSPEDVSEPQWYASISVLKNCVEGDPLIHELSGLYSGYDAGETQRKIDHYVDSGMGPATCERFRSLNPGGCNGCPHKVKSPILLGEIEAAQLVDFTDSGDAAATGAAPASGGFATVPVLKDSANERLLCKNMAEIDNENRLWLRMQTDELDENGNKKVLRTHVSDNGCYVEGLFTDIDGTEMIALQIFRKANGWVRRTVPLSKLQSRQLSETLCGIGLLTTSRGYYTAMSGWLIAEVDALTAVKRSIRTVSSMGWHGTKKDRSFVIGEQEILADGNTVPVALLKPATERQLNDGVFHHGEAAGTLEGWQAAVNVYNRPGMEAYQFAVLWMLGSPLVQFTQECALVELHGEGGKGKSTLGYIGLASYVHPHKEMVTMASGSTINGALGKAALLKNIPLLLEEASSAAPEMLSQLIYASTDRREKVAKTQTGALRTSGEWANAWMMTTNREVLQLVSAKSKETMALWRRVVSVPYNEFFYPIRDEAERDALSAVSSRHAHYGHAGRIFVTHIMQNWEQVAETVLDMQALIRRELGAENNELNFMVGTYAVVLAAGAIAKQLGIVDYDVKALHHWIINELQPRQMQVRHLVDINPLITLTQVLQAKGHEALVAPINLSCGSSIEELTRVRLPSSGRLSYRIDPDAQMAVVPMDLIKSAAAEQFFDPMRIVTELKKIGALRKPSGEPAVGPVKYNLGRGVGQFDLKKTQDCLIIDLSVIEGQEIAAGHSVPDAAVPPLRGKVTSLARRVN